MAYDEETANRVRQALSGRHDVVERKMMGGLSFMVKGDMVCSVSGRGGLLIRVGAEAREELLKEPHVRPMEMGVRTMAAFIRVDPDGYQTDTALKIWVQLGLDFVTTRSSKGANTAPSRRSVSRR